MKTKTISLYLSLILFFVSIFAAHAGGYKLKIEIAGIGDSVCYLAKYIGDRTYLVDTSAAENNGTLLFKGKEELDPGMYIIAGQSNNKYFDFFIHKEQSFSLATNIEDIAGSMVVKGSKENQLFYDYIRYLSKQQKAIMPLQKLLTEPGLSQDSILKIREAISKIDKEVKSYQKTLIENNSNTLAVTFIKSTIEPVSLSADAFEKSGTDSANTYNYFLDHFWDNLDYTDVRLLHTPSYHPRLERFLTEIVIQHPDSIINAVNILLNNAESHPEVYRYLLWNMIVRYETSDIMGFDAIFVYLIQTRIKDRKFDWLNETVRKNLIDRADILSPLLIGKVAPNMILLDTSNIPVSLHSLKNNFTIIFFWDTDCSFCKKETPKLIEKYNRYSEIYDIEVYGVCIDTSLTSWKTYIREKDLKWVNVNGYLSITPDFHDLYDVHSSPVMYLLDRHKVIIGKRILTDQIFEIILKEEKDQKI